MNEHEQWHIDLAHREEAAMLLARNQGKGTWQAIADAWRYCATHCAAEAAVQRKRAEDAERRLEELTELLASARDLNRVTVRMDEEVLRFTGPRGRYIPRDDVPAEADRAVFDSFC